MSRRGSVRSCVCGKHDCACPSPEVIPDQNEDGECQSLRAARREAWRDRQMAREAAEENRRRR